MLWETAPEQPWLSKIPSTDLCGVYQSISSIPPNCQAWEWYTSSKQSTISIHFDHLLIRLREIHVQQPDSIPSFVYLSYFFLSINHISSHLHLFQVYILHSIHIAHPIIYLVDPSSFHHPSCQPWFPACIIKTQERDSPQNKFDLSSFKFDVGQSFDSKDALETRPKFFSVVQHFYFDVEKSMHKRFCKMMDKRMYVEA